MSTATALRVPATLKIEYAITSTSLGRLLVATTARGICCAMFGDNDKALADELSRRFLSADITPASAQFDATVDSVAQLVENPNHQIDTPLDIIGTAFQKSVWAALRDIPIGSTQNYKQVALTLGKPTASRAVAGACAANRIALVIPCHRVVRTDGSLSGYRWGVERKAQLLKTEKLQKALA